MPDLDVPPLRFRVRGVTKELWAYCSSHDGVQVQIQSPTTLSTSELTLLARAGIELSVRPNVDFDLRELGKAVERFRAIVLFPPVADGGAYRGVDVLNRAIRCRELSVYARMATEIAANNLPRLRSFASDGGVGWSASANPRLRSFWMQARNLPVDLDFRGRIRDLTLGGSPSLSRLPDLAHPNSLRSVDIGNSASFDVSSLLNAPSLRVVQFTHCRQLLNIGALTRLPRLEHLSIHGAHDIPAHRDLLELRISKFWVSENHVFENEFRTETRQRGWGISRFIQSKSADGQVVR